MLVRQFREGTRDESSQPFTHCSGPTAEFLPALLVQRALAHPQQQAGELIIFRETSIELHRANITEPPSLNRTGHLERCYRALYFYGPATEKAR